MKKKIFFRADGNSEIGFGHVIRSLALAEMLKEEFECHFIIQNPIQTLSNQVKNICQSLIELPESNNFLIEAETIAQDVLEENEIVVLDGYHFDTDYQRIFKNHGNKVVCIDDIYKYHFLADVVINHAGGIQKENYSNEPYTQFCLGPHFSLLRKPFRVAASTRSDLTKNDNLFICLGGTDPKNDTLRVLQKCKSVENIGKCFVVLGGGYLHKDQLQIFLDQSSLDVEILNNLDASEMVMYMQKCGKAITPPSTVSYEYLCAGGELYLKLIADNQKSIKQFLINEKLAFDFDFFPEKDQNVIKEILQNQKNTFDGNQDKSFQRLFRGLSLEVRKAEDKDSMLYFTWANDSDVRAQSYNSNPIPIENHKKWFSKKIDSSEGVMYIMNLDKNPIGQIRFDFHKDQATIGFSLGKNYRGLGLGKEILRRGVAQFRSEFGNQYQIIGFVKKTNMPSVKAFRGLGFEEEEAIEYENSFKYILS